MTKEWLLVCPRGHRVKEPMTEIHDTPDGIMVALTCSDKACNGVGAVMSFPAVSYVDWAEAKEEAKS